MINDILPLVSIIIATFNSGKVLPLVLEAIKRQSYPKDKIEILAVDGGSTDNTRDIAQKYDCIILENPKTDVGTAKFIGFQKAQGKYVITIDHDEVLVNQESIKTRIEALLKHPECKVAFCSGTIRPDKYPLLNQYISDVGDPFTFYMYHGPCDYRFIKRNFTILIETGYYIKVEFNKNVDKIFLELLCGSTIIDSDYFKSFMSWDYSKDFFTFGHFFYIMLNSGNKTVIFTKNDFIEHYSVDSIKAYLPKLKWRIINNVHFPEKANIAVTGRESLQKINPLKKYFFIPYSLTFICPLVEGIIYAIKRKNIVYLMHPLLCIYVAVQILWQYLRKIINRPPAFTSYDGKKKLDR